MDDVRVLGIFRPSRLQSEVIETEIKPLLPTCCQRERVSVRIPDPRVSVHPDNRAWHQDGGGLAGTTRHMVVWASEQPTEIRDAQGVVFIGQPYDLVWFNNDIVHHRQPLGTDEGRRWFLGVRCSGE